MVTSKNVHKTITGIYIFNNGIIKNYLMCRFSEIQYICEQPYIIEICPQDHEAVLDSSQNLCSLIILIENIKKKYCFYIMCL